MDDLVSKLRSMARVETSALYSQRKTLNEAADLIDQQALVIRELVEALRRCISPIGGYAITNESQTGEVLSGFLTQIFKTSDIARAAIAKADQPGA